MKFIKGTDRNQTYLFPVSLEGSIDQDNEVRLIDLLDFGFRTAFIGNGRPGYHPGRFTQIIYLWLYE